MDLNDILDLKIAQAAMEYFLLDQNTRFAEKKNK